MSKQTERLEQEFIDAFIEKERQPRKDTPEQIGRVILEKTDLGQLEYDSLGTYITEEWK